MGNPEWETAARTFKRVKNVYLEICSSFTCRSKIETVVKEIGAQRIVFGSDSTLINPTFIIGMVIESDISKEEKEKIFYLNAKDLLSGKLNK